jgi:hypothetical protein
VGRKAIILRFTSNADEMIARVSIDDREPGHRQQRGAVIDGSSIK